MKREQILNISIIALVLIAAVLGYVIYQQQLGTSSKISSNLAPTQTTATTTGQAIVGPKVSCEGMDINAIRTFIRNAPNEKSTPDEQKNYISVINCLAKEGDFISFADQCVPTPAVLNATGYQVSIKNNGKEKITVRSITGKGQGLAYDIAPGATQLYDFKTSNTTFHVTSCYLGNQREGDPKFDARTAVILTKPIQ